MVGGAQGRGGYRAELEALIVELGLSGRVRLVDHCDDMPAAMMLADVVVSASRVPEGFGRTIAEAQAMGRPVIAPAHGAAAETFLPGETGWLFPPENVEILGAALREALTLGQVRRLALAEKAMAFARDRLPFSRMRDLTLSIYGELL
jgi:glycosyltransferase involved in cell wall biosynthesis